MKIEEIKKFAFKKDNTFYHVFITEPLTVPVLWILEKIKFLSPDHLNFLSLFGTIISAFFFVKGMLITGAIIYFIGYFFDSLDGKLARIRGIASKRGAFVDGAIDAFRPLILTSGLGLYIYKEIGFEFFLISALYVILVAIYQYFCSSSYSLNNNKQVMSVLVEESPKSLIIKLKMWLKKYRLRLGYTTAETNGFAFLLFPIIAGLSDSPFFLVIGYIISTIMILFLISILITLQYKILSRLEQ